jgi:hypothetical protein
MRNPPEFLDRARVLEFASLARSQPTGKTRHVVGGVEVKQFAALAIASYEDPADGVDLFYCDPSWNVITDTWHEDVVAAAIDQANFEFGLLQFHEFAPAG